MSEPDTSPLVAHIDEAEVHEHLSGDHWGGSYQVLTPGMRARGGRLGVNLTTVPPGRVCVPFHSHQREDEVFYIVSGRGVLRYGDTLQEVGPGHCISCPAGTGVAHQLANPFDEPLRYLAIGDYDKDEVCVYPDSGKGLVRSLGRVGWLEKVPYMEGEPERPKVLDLIENAGDRSQPSEV